MSNLEGEDLGLSTQVHYSKALNAQLTMDLGLSVNKKNEASEETVQELRIKVTRMEYGLPDEEEPMEAPKQLAIVPRSPNRHQLCLEE